MIDVEVMTICAYLMLILEKLGNLKNDEICCEASFSRISAKDRINCQPLEQFENFVSINFRQSVS